MDECNGIRGLSHRALGGNVARVYDVASNEFVVDKLWDEILVMQPEPEKETAEFRQLTRPVIS